MITEIFTGYVIDLTQIAAIGPVRATGGYSDEQPDEDDTERKLSMNLFLRCWDRPILFRLFRQEAETSRATSGKKRDVFYFTEAQNSEWQQAQADAEGKRAELVAQWKRAMGADKEAFQKPPQALANSLTTVFEGMATTGDSPQMPR